MDAEQIRKQIEEETRGNPFPSAENTLDLRQCLVEPVKKIYRDAAPTSGNASDDKLELWLVLEECPGTGNGYKIVYDADENIYGLAYYAEPEDDFLGYYGSFLETLEAM